MEIEEVLDQIENQFFGELEENRESVIPVLKDLHQQYIAQGPTETQEFEKIIVGRIGGIYIPYLFWKSLSEFLKNNETRNQLYFLIEGFTQSSFDEIEQKLMKPLLTTYFDAEKEFYVDKIMDLVVPKAHPSVQEYFTKLKEFLTSNKNSVSLFKEKFDLVKDIEPDFELLKMPVTRLKEKMHIA